MRGFLPKGLNPQLGFIATKIITELKNIDLHRGAGRDYFVCSCKLHKAFNFLLITYRLPIPVLLVWKTTDSWESLLVQYRRNHLFVVRRVLLPLLTNPSDTSPLKCLGDSAGQEKLSRFCL